MPCSDGIVPEGQEQREVFLNVARENWIENWIITCCISINLIYARDARYFYFVHSHLMFAWCHLAARWPIWIGNPFTCTTAISLLYRPLASVIPYILGFDCTRRFQAGNLTLCTSNTGTCPINNRISSSSAWKVSHAPAPSSGGNNFVENRARPRSPPNSRGWM